MVVYTSRVYKHTIGIRDAAALSANIVLLSIFYCFIGGLVSYALYYLFDEYNPDDKAGIEWETKGGLYQLADVCMEIAIVGLVSFWLVFTINTSAPIIPVPVNFAQFVDTYTTGMFFIYAIFIFMNDLTSKLRYLYETYFEKRFASLFPNEGSILDLSLRYTSSRSA